MSNFTPGPWEVVKDEVLGFIIPHPTEKALLIARVPNKANAVAIAAVPEMKDLLEDAGNFILDLIHDKETIDDEARAAFDVVLKIGALLRRIEGEEETDEL